MALVVLTLPKPPSANVYWRRGRNGRIHVSTEARLYKLKVGSICLGLGVNKLDGPLRVTMHCYICDKRADMANWEKVTLDALQGFAYEDDNAVVELHMYRHKAPTRIASSVYVEIEQVIK